LEPSSSSEPSDIDVMLFKTGIPENAEVLIVVDSEKNSSIGELSMYVKETNAANEANEAEAAEMKGTDTYSWNRLLSCRAMLGMGGLYKEKEGDNKTPVGVFKMNTPFGIMDPLPGFPKEYIKVDGTYFWNGDSLSPSYNRLVKDGEAIFDKSESEHLTDYAGYYDYCLNIGYNDEGTPYRGSALFLHCEVDGQETHGCIAVPKADMIEIMKHFKSECTWMIIREKSGA
ncbi:MAG: L,D-transpeptidase family protein, partial [Eubacteriales bacterium]|nr:L,D-transpeptidase family protein [Eubacteriales bacterium]